MTERLIVDVSSCTECRTCELQCSFTHWEVFNAGKSGIHIVSAWPELPQALVCRQCDEPECLEACPVEALVYTEAGALQVLCDECTGCGACVEACSYGGIWLDPQSGVAIKCDTCDGRFECIARCFAGALSSGE